MDARRKEPWIATLGLAAALSGGCGAPGTGGLKAGARAGAAGARKVQDALGTEGPAEGVEIRVSFAEASEVQHWNAVDDVVMGGVSSSSLSASGAGTAVFAGEVRLENRGGFASVRSKPREWSLGGARGIALRVRGDGKTYKLNARTDDAFDGVTWQSAFETSAGEWQTVHVAFEELEPRWRGRLVSDAAGLLPEQIRTLGLLISDGQAGPFRLELKWIAAWR